MEYTPISEPVVTQKTTSNRKFIIPIIALSVISVCFAGLMVWLSANNQSHSDTTSADTADGSGSTQTENESKAAFAEEYTYNLRPFLQEINDNYNAELQFGVSIVSKLNNYDFATYTDGYNAISSQPNETQPELDNRLRNPNFYKQITDRLIADGFKDTGDSIAYHDVAFRFYRNDEILCNVPSSSDSNVGDDGLLFSIPGYLIACADISTVERDLEEMKPFAIAYKDKTGQWPLVLSVNRQEDALNSKHSPYQIATLSGDDSLELFYRVSPSSQWIYFTGTQSALSCTDFNTDDLRKAFLGETCVTDDGESGEVSL